MNFKRGGEDKLLGLAIAGIILFGVVSMAVSGSDTEDAKALDYAVIKDEEAPTKRVIEVVLHERVSEAQLEKIAATLYEDRPGSTFIGYYIEGEGDYAYWATTHYNPDLSVNIIGSTGEQELQMTSDDKADGEVVGKWRVSRGYNSTITILERDEELRVVQRFQDGSAMDNPAQIETVDGQARIYDGIGEANGEYYVIDEQGRLQFWSDNGNYYTAPIDE